MGVMASGEQVSHEQGSDEQISDAPLADDQIADALSRTEQAPLEQRAARYGAFVDRLVERLEPPAHP